MTQAILCTWLVLGIEWAVVVLFSHRQMAGLWELQYGSLLLAPTVLLVGALLGVVGGWCWNNLARSAEQPTARWHLAFAALAFGGGTAWGVSFGRHFEPLAKRAAFVALVGIVAALIIWWSAPRVARAISNQPRATALTTAAICLGLELLNRFWLVRLYPGWHLALAILTLLLAPGLGGLLQLPQRPARIAVIAGLAIAALSLVPSTRKLSTFDNFRLVLIERAPQLGNMVRVNARFAALLADSSAPATAPIAERPETKSNEAPLDLRGRDVLLVSIDALRADHLGAYGYKRPTTPELDRLASTGVVFDQAYCPTPHTSYSVTSLLTGKYLRPLLLQGAGEDSLTLANVLRVYGYATAAFYPPAVFFIDRDRFASFQNTGLGFEFRKEEFMEGEGRVAQVRDYLRSLPADRRVFLWVHLFAPHEPYEVHPGHDFGQRDVDRYDSEVAFADATLGSLVQAIRGRDPRAVVITTADHGEEFGEHGGRYHGSSVYDEQARVPLIVSIPGHPTAGHVVHPVQTIDIFATLLRGLHIPPTPRIRGRDLSPWLSNPSRPDPGFAFAETDDHTLLAEGTLRLICERRIDACQLFDVATDPGQQRDVSADHQKTFAALREKLRSLNATHGEYESHTATAGGTPLPAPMLRGIAGDFDAAIEIAGLLDDSKVELRRKAAELLFQLKNPATAAALRLSLAREEDAATRAYCALSLTRLGQGAPLVYDLLVDPDLRWRRLASLALAETGDARGEAELIAWWSKDKPTDFEESRTLIAALAKIRSRDAAWSLGQALDDVRLRPHIARALASIGEQSARGPLLKQFEQERYHGNRSILLDALLKLGAKGEIEKALRRFLGVPDPVENGVFAALSTGILERLGGPSLKDLKRLRSNAALGERVRVVVPKPLTDAVRAKTELRLILRASNLGPSQRWVRIGRPEKPTDYNKTNTLSSRKLSLIHAKDQLMIQLDPGPSAQEIAVPVPGFLGLAPGKSSDLVVVAETGVSVEGFAIVPLAEELPPPPPEPWAKTPD